MVKQFSKYFSIGILNTLIHWATFFVAHISFSMPQSISNILGFSVAVIFSFFMNAKFTFQQPTSIIKFLSYTIFMGVLSFCVGYLADIFQISGIITLVAFSAISLLLGFLYSKFIVFKG